MEMTYPKFTKEMKATHTILIPNMAVTQFRLLKASMESEGYHVEVLGNCGSQVAQLGLKYVHNDTCYPALLVIGQFLDALNSGKYDLEHTALAITQTGGGCRASNYIHLLRKAAASIFYGDLLVTLRNQTAPYEVKPGAADALVDHWVRVIGDWIKQGRGFSAREMKHTFPRMAAQFAAIPVKRVPKVKVGIVGEIYVKYLSLIHI